MAQMKWVEKKMVILAILGREDGSLPTMRDDKESYVWWFGGLMGTPRVPDDYSISPCRG